MKLLRITLRWWLAVICAAMLFSSCLKKNFDAPPKGGGTDPNLPVTASFGQISNMAIALGAGGARMLGDTTIAGIVVANDSSGNLYDDIVVEDSTGGLTIAIKESGLYQTYRVGDKVYIKLNGLWIVNYKGTPELAAGIDPTDGSPVGIAAPLAVNYIIPATSGNPVTPIPVSLLRLSASPSVYVNRLVIISNTQFTLNSAGFAQYTASPTVSTGLTLEDCSGGTLELYTSNYSYFRGVTIPQGQGTITGVYTLYGTSGQLEIRDTSDVAMYSARCGATVSIDSIRKIGAPHALGAYTIHGVVIASVSDSMNFPTGNIILQSIDPVTGHPSGVDVYYGSANIAYHVGDSLEIDVTGDSLTTYPFNLQGVGLEIVLASTSQVRVLATGIKPYAQKFTSMQALSTAYITEGLENTLIQLPGGTLSPAGSTYGAAKNIIVGGISIAFYTSKNATFYNELAPTVTATYTGIVSSYNGSLQFQIRYPSDVQP